MSSSPVLNLIARRGERIWYRNVSRSVDYSTGDQVESYADNKSTFALLFDTQTTVEGKSILLPSGKVVMYGRPQDYANDSMLAKVNDIIIQLPNNYSSGTSVIYRVDRVRNELLFNQSDFYCRLDLTLTKSKE